MESFIGKHKAMEQAVASIVSPSDSPEVKLQKIYARVQQIRNTTYEQEKTEQEQKRSKEKEPDNVEAIWKKQYGNGSGSDLAFPRPRPSRRIRGLRHVGCRPSQLLLLH